jgi:hypothetical protein
MTTTPTTEPTTFDVPGWERPAWASAAEFIGDDLLSFSRDASVIPVVASGPEEEPTPSPVSLCRHDQIRIDAESGTMSIEQGPTMIYLDIEGVTVSEARRLAAALVELADAADGAR